MARTVLPSGPSRYAPLPDSTCRVCHTAGCPTACHDHGMRCSVLVVDDHREFRSLAARMLSAMGLTVVGEASSFAAAEAMVAELRPDAALVDIGLPDGDGTVLAQRLAALPWRPRIVLTSSDPDAGSTTAARSSGAIGFIAKEDLPSASLRAMLVGE